jgi:hypothetical protein
MRPECCLEREGFGTGFGPEEADKLGLSCEAPTTEKKLADSLAETIGFEPTVAL